MIRNTQNRIFSVMQKRDDLPEMTLPLAILLIILTTAFSCAGAKLLSSAVTSFSAVEELGQNFADGSKNLISIVPIGNLAGFFASIPFLPVAVCLYSLVILLWRRVASLIVTPVSAVAMYFIGVDLFSAVVFVTTVLLCAYTFAVSMISRETKFRRMLSLAVAAAICIVLSIVGFAGIYFGTFSQFVEWFAAYIGQVIADVYGSKGGYSISAAACSAFAGKIMLMLPAYVGIISTADAWVTDLLAKSAFRLLECENVFIELTRRITMPKAYAAVYFVTSLLTLVTSSAYNPFIYAILQNIACTMILPCALIGLSSFVLPNDEEYFYMDRARVVSILLLGLIIISLGMRSAVVFLGICGAMRVIMAKKS